MKWLEIIELRFGGSNREMLESHLKKLINEAKRQSIKVYCHVTVETDFSIHLKHDSKRADVSGSPLGLQLASALKEYGLVNHSVWIEMHSK